MTDRPRKPGDTQSVAGRKVSHDEYLARQKATEQWYLERTPSHPDAPNPVGDVGRFLRSFLPPMWR